MKKIIYILCFLLCFSCAKSNKSEQMMSKDEALENEEWSVESADDYNDTNTKFKSEEFRFTLDEINSEIKEKLQANYESLLLLNKHPEFKDAIKEQLKDSNKFDDILSDSIQSIRIQELEFIDTMTTRNDSISEQKVVYTTEINSIHKQRDSVLVVIKRGLIKIDGALRIRTSFSFEKLD